MKHMVFSARLDKSLAAKVNAAVRKNRLTKKQFLEEAIRDKLVKLAATDDVLLESFNAWHRSETPEKTLQNIRGEFNKNFRRHRET
ncbi:MAG: ribbon-helix-helix protein, CopG family [Spirochaetes bacterium]|nr:ribbon-helix-helix protein, CopG family [Spirochaetota bacterium]